MPSGQEFTLGEALNLALGDLPRVGGILPAVDRPEFPLQRALLTTGAAVPQVPSRIQADRSNHTGQQAPHDGRERRDRALAWGSSQAGPASSPSPRQGAGWAGERASACTAQATAPPARPATSRITTLSI